MIMKIQKTFLTYLFLCLIFNVFPLQAQQLIQTVIHTTPQRTVFLMSITDQGELIGDYYVSLKDFAEALEVSYSIDTVLHAGAINILGTHILLFADNPFIRIENTVYQMPLEVKEYLDAYYFPLREFMKVLDLNLPGDYNFDENNKTLDINFGTAINITDFFIEEKTNGILIHIKTLKYFGNDFHSWSDTSKHHFTVEFYGGKLDTAKINSTPIEGRLVRGLNAFQFPEIATIIFRLSSTIEHYEAIEDQQSGEILISLTKKGTSQTANVLYELVIPGKKSDVQELIAKEKEKWAIDTIVIDPGHGGRDPGTIGPDGIKEKDIVLDIALNLGKLITTSKLVEKVIYTRETDVFVPLQERARIANNNAGKLFISIHINSNTNNNLRGFETYFLHPEKTQDALEVLEVVQRENNVMNLYEGKNPNRELTEEDKMVLAITQSAFAKESEKLAGFISEGLGRTTEFPNNGVKQAGFLVLWGVPMPNTLVEAGYLTNEKDRLDLHSSAVRHRIAEGIYEGIKKFIEEVRK